MGVYAHRATADRLHELVGNVYGWTVSLYWGYEYKPVNEREDNDAAGHAGGR